MSVLDRLVTSLEGIAHALSDNELVVPMYQRSYAWSKRHIDELFQDLATAMREGKEEYFLGSIVLTSQETRRLEVVDGQQRLATTSILLSAIRDYFQEQGDVDRATEIQSKFLFSKNLRTGELNPRLRLNHVDHDFYAKRVLSLPGSSDRRIQETRESHHKIAAAADLAKRRVEMIAAMGNKPADQLLDWLEFVEQKAKIIWVRVPDEVNAFTIFETLNDRGLDLAVSDLLKNYLFSLSSDRIAEVQARWLSTVGILESVESESLLVTYIRHLWASKQGLTRVECGRKTGVEGA